MQGIGFFLIIDGLRMKSRTIAKSRRVFLAWRYQIWLPGRKDSKAAQRINASNTTYLGRSVVGLFILHSGVYTDFLNRVCFLRGVYALTCPSRKKTLPLLRLQLNLRGAARCWFSAVSRVSVSLFKG